MFWQCAGGQRKKGSVASLVHRNLDLYMCSRFKCSNVPSVQLGRLDSWQHADWCSGSGSVWAIQHLLCRYPSPLPCLISSSVEWHGSFQDYQNILVESPFLCGTLLLPLSFFCWLWWILLGIWFRMEVLDVVVVGVICFCRRNMIVPSFLLLDKILWFCGVWVGVFFSLW